MRRFLWTTVVGLVVPSIALAAQTDSPTPESSAAPLFSSHDRLAFVLKAPFNSLFKDRSDEAPMQPATIVYVHDGDSSVMELKVELRGRNRRRRQVCNFPPIRLDFPRSEMGGTIFENQNRIKLVTQCQSGRDQYEQYVFLEYLIYRAYNELTDLSFRVRLADITYVDTEEKEDTITRVGFLIEDDDDMAERNGWEVLEVPMVYPTDVDQEQLSLVEIFQYMIGHTDWSAVAGEAGEDTCCHNGRLVGTMVGPVYPVPYDFDFAGLINARYAEVAQGLGQRTVRQRIYRGWCHPDGVVESTVEKFVANKDAIYALIRNQEGLEEDEIKDAIDYLDDFYKIATDPQRVDREFIRKCRDIP